ncbi:MAG: helix-turn-helix domain-containing protein [Bacteroidota bacterium]
MSKLKEYREKLHLTQKELADKTQISIRTIQRIEAGQAPKGYTLKTLAEALQIDTQALLPPPKESEVSAPPINQWVNLSSLPFTFFPPLNILAPLVIMFSRKAFNKVTKQVVSLQVVWTVMMVILVVSSALIRNAYFLSDAIPPMTLGISIFLNLCVILRNAYEIAKRGKLYIKLNFRFL